MGVCGERLTGSILLSMGLAIAAIWLVNRGSQRARAAAADEVIVESR